MKAALITGGAKRIGRAIVEALAGDGYAVAIHHHRSHEAAAALAAAIVARGGRAAALGCDLASPDCAALVAQAAARVGPLTVLVNNASLFERDEAASLTPERFDRHMAVNARAPALLAREFAAQARARSPPCGDRSAPASSSPLRRARTARRC